MYVTPFKTCSALSSQIVGCFHYLYPFEVVLIWDFYFEGEPQIPPLFLTLMLFTTHVQRLPSLRLTPFFPVALKAPLGHSWRLNQVAKTKTDPDLNQTLKHTPNLYILKYRVGRQACPKRRFHVLFISLRTIQPSLNAVSSQ